MRLKRSLATLMIMVLMLGCIPMEPYAQGNNMGLDRDNAIRMDYNSLSFFTTKENIENGNIIPYYWFELVAGVSDDYTISFEQIPDNSSSEPGDVGPTPYITDAKFFDSQGNELSSTCTTGTTTVLTPTSELEKNKVYYIQAFFDSNGQAIYMTVPNDTDGRHIRPTKSWEITYELNGGTGTAPVDSEWYFGSDTLVYFNKYKPENDPVAPTQGDMVAPAGATFNGWNTKKEGTGKAYAAGDKIASTADVTLYAQWKTPSSSADANSTVYTVNDANHTIAGGSSNITTVTTVQQVLANMTFSEKATYKIVASGQDLSSASNAAGAAAKASTEKIVSGDQLVVIAENGIDYAVYTITPADPPTAPTIGTLSIPGSFTAGSSITLSNLNNYKPTVTATGGATITAQGWQLYNPSGGGYWETLESNGTILPDTGSTYKLRYSVTYGGTTITSNEVTLNVVGHATTLALAASPASPQGTGTPITLTATLTGFFAGPGVKDQTITFKNGSTILGTAALNAGGVATYIWTPNSINTYSLTAEYAASYYNTAATSNTVSWESTAPTDWNGVIPASNSGYTYSGGSGTEASPYLIANSYDLAMLASNVNTVINYSVGKYFKMTANIDLNPGITVTDDKDWTPIGTAPNYAFKGTFDGNNKKITGIKIGSSENKNRNITELGLFGYVLNGTIKNLGVDVAIYSATMNSGIGGLVGVMANDGIGENCIENCYATGNLEASSNSFIGGLVGSMGRGKIANSYSTANVRAKEVSGVGGLVGESACIIQNCYATGEVNGAGISGHAGGLVAYQGEGMITNCYATGNVTSGRGDNVGGLVGLANGTITNNYATGNVTGGASAKVGGLVGYNHNGTIKNNYVTGNVTGTDSAIVGGLVGELDSLSPASIINNYATGNVTGGKDAKVGGVLGYRIKGIIRYSYWNRDAAHTLNGVTQTPQKGIGVTDIDDSTGMTSDSMKADSFVTTLNGNLDYMGDTYLYTWKVRANDYPTFSDKLWSGTPTEKEVTIRGTVKDKDGNPVTGAIVTLTPNAGTPNPATTGNDGKYTINNVPNGSYTIMVILPSSGGTFTKNITVPDAISSGNIDLQQPVAQTYTVTYNGNKATSGSVSPQTTNVGTQTTTAANGFAKTGYTFTGWNTVANGSGTAYLEGSTIPSQTAGTTVTLYAQWTENTYEVSGTVKDNSGSATEGASVKLMKGNTQIGTHGVTTDSSGKFTITGVPNGIYNLVIEKDGITVTIKITVSNGDNELTSAITLPKGKTNSVVEIKPSTPDIVVGGLDELFDSTATDNTKGFTADDKNLVETSGGSVTIKLTAQSTDNTAPNAKDIDMAAQSNTKTIGAYLDLTVLKTAKDSSGGEIHSQSGILVELPSLIEVRIPLAPELQGKTGYVIYRYHGSNVDEITTSPNKDTGEYFTVETDTIILHIKKFSTYAIGYTSTATNNGGSSSGGGSGGNGHSSAVSSTITAGQSEGGKITISDKIATITPDDGYVIADVLVDKKSISATEKYTFTDSNTHGITAVFVKKTALPYYLKNDKKIYIGFSAITEKRYKYIAPAGVNVEYRGNPKNFTDNTLDWSKPSIDFVTEREIFLGTTQDQFGPNESMTRAMFVTVIGRLYERSYGSISGSSTFSDVNENEYYAKYVAWANENGIIKGIGENKFAPSDQVTREQMAAIMLNFASFLKKADTADGSLSYADSTRISSWAIDGAKYCQKTKVITGREGGSFAPQERATRAEVAIVIERFIKTILK